MRNELNILKTVLARYRDVASVRDEVECLCDAELWNGCQLRE